jgi:hypothetical protein
MIKPHMEFELCRADEVAECWDGISEELYLKLWNEIVILQKPIPNLEDSGPHDHIGFESLAEHWHLLTDDEQVYLNDLAVKRDEEWNRSWKDLMEGNLK